MWSAGEMTLRTYMQYWRLLYEAYRTRESYSPTPKSAYTDKTDEEVFREHNNKGDEIEGLDLDSEQDFLKWDKENSSYHNMDVAYARVHLWPRKKGEGWGEEKVDVPEGRWYFTLSFSVYGYANDVVNMLEALCDEGVGVVCEEMARLLRIAEETDWVGITPGANKYSYDETVGNEITLPFVDVDITAEQIAELIAATEWEKVRKVIPIMCGKKNG